jgi:hypothetical protein
VPVKDGRRIKMSNLKPCPFCNCTMATWKYNGKERMKCPNMNCFLGILDYPVIEEPWNYRKIEDQLRRELTEANRRLLAFVDKDVSWDFSPKELDWWKKTYGPVPAGWGKEKK